MLGIHVWYGCVQFQINRATSLMDWVGKGLAAMQSCSSQVFWLDKGLTPQPQLSLDRVLGYFLDSESVAQGSVPGTPSPVTHPKFSLWYLHMLEWKLLEDRAFASEPRTVPAQTKVALGRKCLRKSVNGWEGNSPVPLSELERTSDGLIFSSNFSWKEIGSNPELLSDFSDLTLELDFAFLKELSRPTIPI